MCGAQRYTLPFEHYQCETLPKVYNLQQYQLPFTILGHNNIELSPAMIYCVIYCFYIGLIAPFAGFFASGMKRAWNIKDFGNALPGHGGFFDRTDCIAMTIFFNYFMLSQLILPEEFQARQITDMSRGLQYTEKIELINMIAAKQGLPQIYLE